jgi:hypothetical protein
MANTTKSSHLSPIDVVNSTTGEWRVGPLTSNLTVFNNSVPNNTIINGHVYNGSAINGTTIILRSPSTNVGGISMISFIYMIMSAGIIVLMAFHSFKWIKAVPGSFSSRGRINESRPLRPYFLSQRKFERRLNKIYTRLDQPQSYTEKVPRQPGGAVTSQDLRECRELMRSKYALDVLIYNSRHARAHNRDIIDDKKRQSAGALVDIQRMVKGWVEAEAQWSSEEWKMVQDIHKRIKDLVPNTVQVPRAP